MLDMNNDLLLMAKQQQEAEQQQQQMLMAALKTAMHRPLIAHQVNVSMCGVAIAENGAKTLMVALPNGERYDIGLTEQLAEGLAKSLLKQPDAAEEDAA